MAQFLTAINKPETGPDLAKPPSRKPETGPTREAADETDVVWFVWTNNDRTEGEVIASATWDQVRQTLGDRLQSTDLFPPSYRVRDGLDEQEVEALTARISCPSLILGGVRKTRENHGFPGNSRWHWPTGLP